MDNSATLKPLSRYETYVPTLRRSFQEIVRRRLAIPMRSAHRQDFRSFRYSPQNNLRSSRAQPAESLDRLQTQIIRLLHSAHPLPQGAAAACRPIFRRSFQSHRWPAGAPSRPAYRTTAAKSSCPLTDAPLDAICRTIAIVGRPFPFLHPLRQYTAPVFPVHPAQQSDHVYGLHLITGGEAALRK